MRYAACWKARSSPRPPQPRAIPAYLPPAQLGSALAQESAEWAGLMKTQKIAAQ